MLQAMQAAGFVGVEAVGDVIYARTHPAYPEFTATPAHQGDLWHFAIQWPLRASAAQKMAWNAAHPLAPLDVDLGETRMQFFGAAQDLAQWAALVDEMVITCTAWRRATRQMDEGM